MPWQKVMAALGWLRIRRLRSFMLQRTNICGECPQSSRINGQLKVRTPMCSLQVRRKVYGRRDGPQGFCDFVNGVMCQKNLIRCEALPCFFWHENLHILIELHQDVFHCTAPAESLMWLKEELRDEIRLKFSETVYPDMRYSQLKASRLVTSQALLEAEEHRFFRRVVGVARFLRTLPLDIGFAVKELSHRLAAPRVRDFERCKRLCHCLSWTRGLGVFFPRGRGEDPDGFSLVAYSDSDWAGDRESRKSASSGMIWWGSHLISNLVKVWWLFRVARQSCMRLSQS